MSDDYIHVRRRAGSPGEVLRKEGGKWVQLDPPKTTSDLTPDELLRVRTIQPWEDDEPEASQWPWPWEASR